MGFVGWLRRYNANRVRRSLSASERGLLRKLVKDFSPSSAVSFDGAMHYFLHNREKLREEKPSIKEVDEHYSQASESFRLFVDWEKDWLEEKVRVHIVSNDPEPKIFLH